MPALPASTSNAPRYFDRRCDVELQRLFSAWIPDDGARAVRRALTGEERGALMARERELAGALHPYLPGERDAVEAQLAGMFTGFRSMRQQGEDAEGIVATTAAVLQPFPVWAIAKACMKIARREAGLDPRFAPNDTEIFGVVDAIVKDYRKTLATVEALLIAPVEGEPRALPAPPPIDPGELDAMRLRLQGKLTSGPAFEKREPDGKHAERVAADLAARRKREAAA